MKDERLIRLPEVLQLYPICRASWYAGIQNGKYPKPIKLGKRTSAWRRSDILELIEKSATAGQGGQP